MSIINVVKSVEYNTLKSNDVILNHSDSVIELPMV